MKTALAYVYMIVFSPAAYGLQSEARDPGQESCRDRYISYEENMFNVYAGENGSRGVAIFVGREGGKYWLATPAHVIFKEGADGKVSSHTMGRISIHALDGNAVPLCAGNPYSAPIAGLDLAFVCVALPYGSFVHDEVLASGIEQKDSYLVLGVEGDLTKRREHVRVSQLGAADPRSGSTHVLSNARINPGDSGAVVGNCRGIIGIALNSDQQILTVAAIQSEAKKAVVPWRLSEVEYMDDSKRSVVCPDFGSAPARELVFQQLPRGRQLRVDGCTEVPHAKYEIEAGDANLKCTPQYLTVSSRSSARLSPEARCQVKVAGTWKSEAGDLVCFEAAPRFAQCSGWSNVQSGTFVGTAEAVSDTKIVFRGLFNNNLVSEAASGDFLWSGNALKGVLKFGPWQRELSLQRSP